ncbi:uncharacterized protein MONOS_17847 [Monocercomonoides exilis]|uniref:uncharacterized protein n=1 Tax=Monocercomonoides exilis TaxID=2049356 RepID=UPI00355A22A7|nr:hypothetical protein MONOS_17847 [Monocercomonoides exilis]
MLVGFWWRISQTGDIDYGGGCIDPGTADFRKYEYIFDQLLNISPDSIPANCAADNSTLLVCSAIALKAREEMGYSADYPKVKGA